MRKTVTIDGNEAAAYVAFKTNEVIAIYQSTFSFAAPISSPSTNFPSELLGRYNVNDYAASVKVYAVK